MVRDGREERGFLIAATPRSGSFLLCEGLAASGVAGVPQEYAAPADVTAWRDFHGFASHLEYFYGFPELCRSANGVCGVKLMWVQLLAWENDARRHLRIRASTPELLRSMIGPFQVVRLVRRDALRQAISWVRAQQTGVWSRRRSDPPPGGVIPRYDADLLRDAVNRITAQNARWSAAIARWKVPQLVVAYEELTSDYPATVARVLAYLGLPRETVPGREPVLVRQADDLTDEWIGRAVRDLGNVVPAVSE